MANTRILVDTSIIIDFLRKKNKEASLLWNIKDTAACFMSSITLFELLSGAKTERHFEDIQKLTKWIESVYFDDHLAEVAASIFRDLKRRKWAGREIDPSVRLRSRDIDITDDIAACG